MAETLNPVHRLFENAPPEAAANRLPERMISADSHVTEPPHTYTKYIDPKFRDRAPRITPDSKGGDGFGIEGMPVVSMGGVAGAGIALCGAYLAMLAVMYILTRGLFKVGFEWRRLAQLAVVLLVVAISGELLLPSSGIAGLLLRVLWLAWVPAILLLTRFLHPHEISGARALLAEGRSRVAAFRSGHGEVEAYAEDPLCDI